MALIKCPECGHEISSYADKCIYCGCPMAVITNLINAKPQEKTKPTIIPEEGKFLSSIKEEDRKFINDFNTALESKYPNNYKTKENNKSYAFKFENYPKLLLHFKAAKVSGAIKLEYKTTGKKRRLMPVTGGKYNLNRVTSKLFPDLDKYFNNIDLIKNSDSKETLKKILIEDESIKAVKEEPSKIPFTFIKNRSNSDATLIEAFTTLIQRSIPNIIPKDGNGAYRYHVVNDDGTLVTLCWFANGEDKKLTFRYYKNPIKREEILTKRIDSLASIDSASRIISSIYDYYFCEYDPEPVVQIPEKHEDKPLQLYSHILNAIKGKKVQSDDKTVAFCKEIAEFVLNEVGHNAIKNKDFKTMDDFNRFKFARRYRADFFDYTFSFRHLNEKDAIEFYLYYKASLVVNVIKRYETIYNKEIISDYHALIKSLYKMIKYNDIDYSRADGLMSGFSMVPIKLLDYELERLTKFEK